MVYQIFQWGEFNLHSGDSSPFKIDCDALSDDDVEVLCALMHQYFGNDIRCAIGVPDGGTRIANIYNENFLNKSGKTFLLIDDVYTTGASMREMVKSLKEGTYIGVVLFARKQPTENWIIPIFTMDSHWPQFNKPLKVRGGGGTGV